jgi:hypothetical protein
MKRPTDRRGAYIAPMTTTRERVLKVQHLDLAQIGQERSNDDDRSEVSGAARQREGE